MHIILALRSDYCTVDGAGIVQYKVTKYRRTKAFKSVVRVSYGQGKRREDIRVSIRASVVIRQKFQLPHQFLTFRNHMTL